MGEWLFLAMEQITGLRGYPDVFRLARGVDGSWLDAGNADPDDRWNADGQFVFVSRK